jgi:hypothetical protein
MKDNHPHRTAAPAIEVVSVEARMDSRSITRHQSCAPKPDIYVGFM